MKVAYIRVSSVTQNEERQYENLKDKGIEKYFTEKISAKDTNRPELQAMLDYVREGDTVYVNDFSRLARSVRDLLSIVSLLEAKKVDLVSIKENIDTSTPMGKLTLTVIGAINEFERDNMLERQREGIALAKKEGRYHGGQPKKVDGTKFRELYDKYYKREINKVQFAKQIGVTRPTLDKWLKEVKENPEQENYTFIKEDKKKSKRKSRKQDKVVDEPTDVINLPS